MDTQERPGEDMPRWRGRVIAAHEASYPDPIAFRAGEPLAVGGRTGTWDGHADWVWLWCTDPRGKSGWVPQRYIAIQGDAGRALGDYSAAELTVSAGDVLAVEDEESGWLWCRTSSGEHGWVPAANVACT